MNRPNMGGRPVGGDEHGTPHVDVSANFPPGDGAIDEVYVLVATHPNGSEGIYGQVIGNLLTNFVTEFKERKEHLHALLVKQGTFEVTEKMDIKLEWRTYKRS